MSALPVYPPLRGTFGQGFVPNIADVDTYPRAALGSTMAMADGRMFKYVQFQGTVAVAVGQVVCYIAADVTESQVDMINNARGAGVSVNAIPTGALQYSWIQTRGLANLAAAVGGTPTAGAAITTSGATAGGMAAASAATQTQMGSFISATGNTVSLNFPW